MRTGPCSGEPVVRDRAPGSEQEAVTAIMNHVHNPPELSAHKVATLYERIVPAGTKLPFCVQPGVVRHGGPQRLR